MAIQYNGDKTMNLVKTVDYTVSSGIRDMETIVFFSLYLREVCGMDIKSIVRVFEEPWKWEAEFTEFQKESWIENLI